MVVRRDTSYAEITGLSVKSKTCNSITISYSVSRSANIFCSLDNGVNWLNGGQPFHRNSTGGEITIYYEDVDGTTRLQPNKSYTINLLSRATISNLNRQKQISITTYDIAKLIEAPNITIGSSHNVKWSNPSGASTSLKLCKIDGSTITDYGIVTGTNKTIIPTASTIYALTPNSNTYEARYIITTTINNTNYTNYKDFTFTVTNSNPTAGTLEYKDTNATTVGITEIIKE